MCEINCILITHSYLDINLDKRDPLRAALGELHVPVGFDKAPAAPTCNRCKTDQLHWLPRRKTWSRYCVECFAEMQRARSEKRWSSI